ncbi:MAG: tetratricopeptide repeat protein [Rhodospirillales bacterium]
MKSRLIAAIILILLFSWPGTAAAQSDALTRALQQYQALAKQGRYAEAERFARKALELGEQEFGPEHANTAAILNNLAVLYKAQGRYAGAEPLHKRALAILEKAFGPEHPDVATSLENYAALLRKTGRAAEAARMEARAKAIGAKRAKERR